MPNCCAAPDALPMTCRYGGIHCTRRSCARRMPMPRSSRSMRKARWRCPASIASSSARMRSAGRGPLPSRSRRRVRYVGEPVAVALARDRHTAEDALERITVRYRLLSPVVDAEKAAEPDAPLLHPEIGSNVVSDRAFRYGDPEAAFVAAAHRVSVTTRYPRNAASPLECFVVIAEYLPGEAAYEVTVNFQGPFAMHPVMAMALGVPGNRLRLRTPPHSGGSFGAKHAVFPYVVLLGLAARKAGRTPSGLVRGFGGPQVYFALECLMQRIAATLGLDPREVI